MEGDPFALVEAMTIAGYATGCEQRLRVPPRRVPGGAARPRARARRGAAARLPRRRRDGRGLRVRRRDPQGRAAPTSAARRRRSSSRSRASAASRATSRRSPSRSASSASRRSSTTSRRSSTCSTSCAAPGPSFAEIGTEGSTGTKLLCVSGHVERPGTYEVRFGATLRELLELAGGVPGGKALQAVLLGRRGRKLPRARRPRRAAHVRGCARGRDDARLGRRARPRRDRRPPAPADAHRRVLPQRVVRPVRAVPRRHRAPAGGARATHRRRAARGRRARARADRRGRPVHARRVDLRARPDRVERGRVRDPAAPRLPGEA